MPQSFTNFYLPPTARVWEGRHDSLGEERCFQKIECLDISKPLLLKPEGIALLGFACDVGVTRNLGRGGASHGPTQLRRTLGNLTLPANFSTPLYDVGDIFCYNDDLEAAQLALADAVNTTRVHGLKTLVLGGGHETAWGHYLGLLENTYPNFGVINIDAHFDMRPILNGKSSSGTPFLQIAEHRRDHHLPFHYCCIGIQETANTISLQQTAREWGVVAISAETLHAKGFEAALPQLNAFIHPLQCIYLSICLDAIASCYAPGVSAPQVYGLLPWHVRLLIRHILASGKVISLDIVEYAPTLDQDNRTAQLAAGLVYEFLCGA